MADDDDLAYQLSRGYAENREVLMWHQGKYMAWAKDLYEKYPVVYLVWLDSMRPHEVGFTPIKDEHPMHYRREVIPCESAMAARLQTMLKA
jgi:hypothetical protein